MTAPKGTETRIVGMRVTLVTNQACSMNSAHWNGRRPNRLVTS